MNFSDISPQTILGRALRLPLRLIPSTTVLPILQGELRGKKWICGSSNHGCWLGSYEKTKQDLFAQIVSPGDVVFDVGAHVGFYTLLASKLTGESGQVIAFEPVPRNLVYLREHLRLNQIKNVKIIAAAVSDAEDDRWFKNGASSTMGRLCSTGDFKVRTVSLDALFARGEIPIPSVIKMDIEGGEYQALLGAETILKQYHPVIFLATHGREIHADCCRYLTSIGYELKPITGTNVADTDEIAAFYKLQNEGESKPSERE